MQQRVEGLIEVLSSLSHALSASLDPAGVLERTATALDGVVDVAGIELDLGDEGRMSTGDDAGAGDPHVVALRGLDRPVGTLVLHPGGTGGFEPDELALLEAVGAQVAGALERSRRFQEVMELERLKTGFIARVSHELRTPITIVSGFLDTLLAHDERLSSEQRRHMLERARSASARLARLIEELLVLSRIEAGVLMPEPDEVRWDDVFADVRGSATEPDQVVVVAPEGAALVSDRDLLGRAVGLVVDNALKYGGTAELTLRREGTAWTLDVRDRGPGFHPDVREVAFEMFTRGPETGATPGLGVGLPIARTLVEVLDGRIEVVGDLPGGEAGGLVRLTIG